MYPGMFSSILSESTEITAHTLTHKKTAPTFPSHTENLNERLRLFGVCLVVKSLRDGVIRHVTAAAHSTKENYVLSRLALAGRNGFPWTKIRDFEGPEHTPPI